MSLGSLLWPDNIKGQHAGLKFRFGEFSNLTNHTPETMVCQDWNSPGDIHLNTRPK